MKTEKIMVAGILTALVMRKGNDVVSSTFFSPSNLNLQIGLLKRPSGFVEAPHYHFPTERKIDRVEQFIYLLEGEILLHFFDKNKKLIKTIKVRQGDGVLIIEGIHSMEIIKNAKAISVKQGPFLGEKKDKIDVKVKI